jgi:hypothetical protein
MNRQPASLDTSARRMAAAPVRVPAFAVLMFRVATDGDLPGVPVS